MLKAKVEQAILEQPPSQILIPCSSKNKILALLLMLENLFQNNQKLQQVTNLTKNKLPDPVAQMEAVQAGQPLPAEKQTVIEPVVVYLEHMSKETIDVAKSHTSWMNFKDNSQFQDIEQNPFNFQYIKAITKLEEYRNMAYWQETNRLKPLIIITSMASMNQGYSRQILREFTARDQNEIVFIERANGIITRESIAGKLFTG